MSVNIFKNGVLKKIAGAVGDALPLANNLLTTVPGSALDATQGTILDEKVSQLNRNLGDISNIGNDTYNSFEKLLQYYIDNGYLPDVNNIALIPVMTSNTTPSGVASASSINSTSEDAWCAFDGNDSSQWIASGTSDCWIQYKFDNPSKVKKVSFIPSYNSSGIRIKNYKIQASNDGSAWDDLTDWLVCPNTEGQQTITLLNTTSYVYYRMSMSGTYGTNIGLKTLQLFGQ